MLICHALSGDSHVARHDADDDARLVGHRRRAGQADRHRPLFRHLPEHPGRLPRHDRAQQHQPRDRPALRRRLSRSSPSATWSRCRRLLVDHLGIERLRAVVGGSLGGHMALTWATRLPDRVAGAIALATSPRLTSQALAFDVVGRNAILRDPAYQDGQYYGNGPRPGGRAVAGADAGPHHLPLARGDDRRSSTPSGSSRARCRRQFETRFSVGSYLAYQGDKFVERFDANSYLTLTMAMDLFDLGDTPQKLAAVAAAPRSAAGC